jgi:RNA polymerase sigma-70 factor (ECF subfamily)
MGANGPAGAFACVAAAWQAHEAELRGYLRHRMADAEAADDVLQDVFVKAMRQGRAFCTLDNPRAWLFQWHATLVDRMHRPPHEPGRQLARSTGRLSR